MARVLVGVAVTYIVTVVHMVEVDVASFTTLVASLGRDVVVVDPVIVNSPPLIIMVAVVCVVTVSSTVMGVLTAVLVGAGISVLPSVRMVFGGGPVLERSPDAEGIRMVVVD